MSVLLDLSFFYHSGTLGDTKLSVSLLPHPRLYSARCTGLGGLSVDESHAREVHYQAHREYTPGVHSLEIRGVAYFCLVVAASGHFDLLAFSTTRTENEACTTPTVSVLRSNLLALVATWGEHF